MKFGYIGNIKIYWKQNKYSGKFQFEIKSVVWKQFNAIGNTIRSFETVV